MDANQLKALNIMHHLSKGGGVVTHTLSIAKAARELGHEMSFVTLHNALNDPSSERLMRGMDIEYAFSTLRVPNIMVPLLLARKGKSVAIARNVSVVQAFDGIITGAAAYEIKRSTGLPVAIRLGTDLGAHLWFQFQQFDKQGIGPSLKSASKVGGLLPLLMVTERFFLGTADVLVCNCEYLRDIYHSKTGGKRNIVVIRNGVNTKKFSPQGPAYGLSSEHFWLAYIGRIERRKGLDILLNAMPSILKSCPKVKLLLVGRAPDIHFLAYLKYLIRKLSIERCVQFLGPVPNSEVPHILRAVDMQVFPSTTGHKEVEGLPNAVLEGMACGVPVMATNVAGVPEVVDHMKTGVLIAPGSCESIWNAVQDIYNNPKLGPEIGHKARLYVVKNNSIEQVAERYIKLYERMVSKKG